MFVIYFFEEYNNIQIIKLTSLILLIILFSARLEFLINLAVSKTDFKFVINITDADGNTVVEAEVPMAEMGNYAIDLRAMTQARGSFTLEFVRYEEVPKANQAKIIEEAKNDD